MSQPDDAAGQPASEPTSTTAGTAPAASQPEATAPAPGWAPDTSSRRRRPLAAPDGNEDQGANAGSNGEATRPGTEADDAKLFSDKASTFTQLARGGLAAVGGLLNMVAGAGTDAFIPDQDDDASIPPPVGRIVARRVQMSEDANLSDAGDIVAAAIGLAAWLAKSLLIIVDARMAAKRQQGPAQHQSAAEAPHEPYNVVRSAVVHEHTDQPGAAGD